MVVGYLVGIIGGSRNLGISLAVDTNHWFWTGGSGGAGSKSGTNDNVLISDFSGARAFLSALRPLSPDVGKI